MSCMFVCSLLSSELFSGCLMGNLLQCRVLRAFTSSGVTGVHAAFSAFCHDEIIIRGARNWTECVRGTHLSVRANRLKIRLLSWINSPKNPIEMHNINKVVNHLKSLFFHFLTFDIRIGIEMVESLLVLAMFCWWEWRCLDSFSQNSFANPAAVSSHLYTRCSLTTVTFARKTYSLLLHVCSYCFFVFSDMNCWRKPVGRVCPSLSGTDPRSWCGSRYNSSEHFSKAKIRVGFTTEICDSEESTFVQMSVSCQSHWPLPLFLSSGSGCPPGMWRPAVPMWRAAPSCPPCPTLRFSVRLASATLFTASNYALLFRRSCRSRARRHHLHPER